MRLSNELDRSHHLSKRFDDGKEPSRVSSRLDNLCPTDKLSFPDLKERLEIQKETKLNAETDNPQFIILKFLKYGIRRDHNEWSLLRSLGDIKIFNKS